MVKSPGSLLTLERPDLWLRAITLANGLTGIQYEPKAPGPDGSIFACSGGYWEPPPERTPEEKERDEIKSLEQIVSQLKRELDYFQQKIDHGERAYREYFRQRRDEINERLKKAEEELARRTGLATLHVYVPEGAMEWLLHETGHWVAATPEERRLPDYGYGQEIKGVGKDREWQAWAFEEIVLAPFGPSRAFTPPKQRGGVAFSKNQPIPKAALRHVERNLRELPVDLAEWRALYGAWIVHEQAGPDAPQWSRLQ